MAKIRVEQIKDLMLTPAPNGNENVTRTIQIGANSIVPLTGFQQEAEGATGYISGLSVSGNVIELTRTALPVLTIANNGTGTFVLNAAVDPDNKHQINLTKGTFDVSTNAEGETPAHTGSLIFGDDKKLKVNADWVNSVVGDGKLKVKFGTDSTDTATDLFSANAATDATLTLAKVAKTGKAEDVKIDVIAGLTATTLDVQTALEELAQKATDIEVRGKEAIEVNPATGENATGKVVSLKIASTDKVLSQDGNGLKTTLTVDTKKYTAEENAAKAGKTYIQIKGIGGEVISETDAAAFVKDGMLDTATIVKGTWTGESFTESADGKDKAIKLVWNTDAGKEAMYINAETLVDSYTSGNDWIEIDQTTNKISHKTQSGLPTTAQGIVEDVAGTGAYAETKTFKVPQLTVDAAGHVTVVTEKEVSITLPDAPTTTTKKVYTPAEQQKTGEGTFTVVAGACHFRMYMNGQLLDSDAYTVVGTTVTYNPNAYVSLETTDRMDLVYFIEEEITVFAPATQEPAPQA